MMKGKFWSRVRKTPGCWEWIGSISPEGYGRFYPAGNLKLYAHRVAYSLKKGAIPKGLIVCHRCDNPRCVRPDHLFLGTHADNSRDKWKKGRGVHGKAYGELACHAKLTWEKADQIRANYSGRGDCRRFAKKYGISESAMSALLRGKTWRIRPCE